MEYVSMNVIKAEHVGHFFDPSAMRFFDSRLSQYGARLTGGQVLFVTSERFDERVPRLYTVRMQGTSGRIADKSLSPVLTFQRYPSSVSAWRALRRFAKLLEG